MPIEYLEEGNDKLEYLDEQGTASGGLVGKVGQGLTLGFGDELQAGLFAAPRALGNLITGKEDASLGGAYDELLGEARSDLRAAQEQYPIASTALEVGSALGTGVAGAGTKLGRFIAGKTAQGFAPTAATAAGRLAGRAGAGAAIGGAGGAAYGFGTGEGIEGRLENAQNIGLAGAAIGGGLPIAGAGLGVAGQAIAPKIDEGLREVGKLAQKYDIPLSLDQLTSSRAIKTAQKVSQDLPFSGQEGFRDKQMKAFNKALFKTVGVESDRFTPDIMDGAFKSVGGDFDKLTKGKNFDVGSSFVDDLIATGDDVASQYGNEAFKIYQKEALKIIQEFGEGSVISGDKLAIARNRLNKLSRKASPDIKPALQDLEMNVVDAITSKDPALAKHLSRAKQKYKNLIVLEPVAVKAKGGNISPALLNNRVAQVYKRAHTTGQSGDIGDIARIGHELLPELGGSDTQARSLMAGLAGGGLVGAAAAPAATLTGAGLTGAGLATNRLLQSVLNRNQGLIKRLLNSEKSAIKELMELPPKEAQAIQELVRKTQGVN